MFELMTTGDTPQAAGRSASSHKQSSVPRTDCSLKSMLGTHWQIEMLKMDLGFGMQGLPSGTVPDIPDDRKNWAALLARLCHCSEGLHCTDHSSSSAW